MILSHERPLIFLITIVSFALLEFLIPYRNQESQAKKRWSSHFFLIFIFVLFQRLLLPIGLAGLAMEFSKETVFYGLLEKESFAAIILTFIILDFFIYFQHRLFHKINFLWRFHEVHHTDDLLDWSSALRFHPVEMVISFGLKVCIIFVFKLEPLGVVLFEVILSSMAIFNHAKIRIPSKLDKVLEYFIVTPRMHRVHHSVLGKEMNSNYSNSISVWDYIFRTFCYKKEEQFKLGVNSESPAKHGLIDLIKKPFIS